MSRRPLIILCLIVVAVAACSLVAQPTQTPRTNEVRDRPLPTATSTSLSPASPTPYASYPPPATPHTGAYPGPRVDAPRVVDHQPRYSRLTERRPTVRFTFDRLMDHASVAAALRIEPIVPLDFRWEGDRERGETIAIQPRRPLAPGAQFQLTLAQTATGAHGVPLRQAYRWTYRLADALAGTSWPTSSDRDVPITIRFNYPVDTTSVEQALDIEPNVEGDLRWNAAQTEVALHPKAPLPVQTDYTIRFDGQILDTNGDALPAPAPLHFTTPPPILAVTPRDGQTVHPATAVQVTFDRLMGHEATAGAFRISPEIAGTFEWRETTLIFRPEQGYLEPSTHYTATIDTTASDPAGQPVLRRSYGWSFRTGALRDLATFGSGPNAQVVDVDGRRAVQFQLFEAELASVRFELYRLNLEQFLDRYASGFRGVAGREDRPISTEGTSLMKSWTVDTTQGASRRRRAQEVLIPNDVPPGFYILNLVAGHVNDQLILILTRHAIAVKQAEGQIVAWVTDVNGGSAPNIEVSVYARDGQLLTQGRTDESGIFRTAVSRDPQPLIVVARAGDDITATGLSNEWLSPRGRWWGWWRPAPEAHDYAAHIYTDRPIYRPGQTVFFKGILRQDDDAILSLPAAGTPVTARIRDARDNVVRTFELATNAFGTVHGEFQLAEGAMLGQYAVELELDGESHRQAFKVEDYRKPDYQVSVTTDPFAPLEDRPSPRSRTGAERYIVGDTITVDVESRYFFGEPVPNARLTVKRYALGPRYWWDERAEAGYIWYRRSSKQEIQAVTDANGRYTFTLPAEMNNYGRSVAWRSSLEQSTWGIEVTVDDGSHQTVSGFTVVRVFNAAEKLRLDTGGYFKTPGRPFTVRAEAATITDEPVPDRALRLELRRYSRSTRNYTTVVQSADLTTDANGRAERPFTVEEPGYYQLRLSGPDTLGNEIHYNTWLYVFSDTGRWTRYRSDDLDIGADRETYAPGDIARLAIESSFSGPALLTFERGTVRREQLIQLTAPLTLVEVPIQPDDVPNIFVTVNAWQAQDTTLTGDTWTSLADSRLLTASVELKVAVTGKRLNVTITPDKEHYAPREEATFTLSVTDEQGDPVSAELSLALVDEAIFNLSEELAGPVFDAFYQPRENIVRTYDAMALSRYLGDGLGGGGGGGGTAANPRSDFPDTAAWLPVVHTDRAGEASVMLTLPDSLTSWRLTARATTAEETQVGEASINIVTRQPIVVRPILPRSLTAGDQVELSAMVHNYTDAPRDVEVSIQIHHSRFTIDAPITQTVRLKAGEQRIVGWSGTVDEAGDAEITVVADALPPAVGGTERGGDAVRLHLPVRPLAVPQVETQIGEFSGEFTTEIDLPEDALDLSSVKIELSRSVAGSLLTGLEYLTGYPYGCVEQTMSRALPNAVVGRAFHQLGVGNPTLQADLPALINAGLQKLYGYQHNDGGWGWWYDDSSHDYQTAWVVFGLTVTAEAGYEVDPQVIQRGAEWLKQHLAGMDIRTRAFALYSMAIAGYGDLGATRTLVTQLDDGVTTLDTFSQAALALALHELGAEAEAREIVGVLAETAVATDGKVHWENADKDGKYYRKTMASDTRSTALALSAFVHIAPEHELEPGIVRWLMGRRRQHGWGTTNETAFTIIALTDHLLATEEATADTHYRVALNGEVIDAGTLGRGEPAVSLEVPAGQMRRGRNTLRIEQSGGGRPSTGSGQRLYYMIANRVYLPEAQIEAAGNVQVARAYLDPETNQPVEAVEAGELVKVRLTVQMPEEGFYIIVEDNLPGGLEALNERLNTTGHVASAYEEPRYYWRQYGYNHKEVRGDRVSFFSTELGAGRHTYTYLARATHTGQFAALPAEVSAMYDLATWGRSASGTLQVGRGQVVIRNTTANVEKNRPPHRQPFPQSLARRRPTSTRKSASPSTIRPAGTRRPGGTLS